jgi:hypothetical protein
MAEATLERFDGNAGAIGAERLNLDGPGPQKFGCGFLHV